MLNNILKWSYGRFFLSSPFTGDNIFRNLVARNNNDPDSGIRTSATNSFLPEELHSGILWINSPQYSAESFKTLGLKELINTSKPVFVSCCDEGIARQLSHENFETIKVGKEAVLNLNCNHFVGSRLKQSVRSGLRRGMMKEYDYSRENASRLEEFKSKCTHGGEPRLKYFFKDIFTSSNRLFVFEDKNGCWQGALMLSGADDHRIKTDLILRKRDAPNGMMEALIFETFSELKSEGFETWSLGEVPYIIYDSPSFSKEYWINLIGRKTKFAYNYAGLFKFKDKFNPEWNDVFICTKRGLNFFMLLKILLKSNLIILILYKALFGLS